MFFFPGLLGGEGVLPKVLVAGTNLKSLPPLRDLCTADNEKRGTEKVAILPLVDKQIQIVSLNLV